MADLFTSVLSFLPAAGALGTAAMGFVDSLKVIPGGGPSQIGFRFIETELQPFLPPPAPGDPAAFGDQDVLVTLKANYINGMAKSDQKAAAKALIHLGLTRGHAVALATAAGVDDAKLQSLTEKVAAGITPTQDEINVLGQFDVVLSAKLDAAYERADQLYRNGCKALSFAFSAIFGVLGGWLISSPATHFSDLMLGLLIGISATPLAPVAKDLASSLQAAVGAFQSVRRG
jgi:hypothetical protein